MLLLLLMPGLNDRLKRIAIVMIASEQTQIAAESETSK